MAEKSDEAGSAAGVTPSQPGAVISPGGQTAAPLPPSTAPVQVPPPSLANQALAQPDPAEAVVSPDPSPALPGPGNEPVLEDDEANAPLLAGDGSEISWTASEFIAHEKSPGWYLGLIVTAVIVAAIIYWLTRDFVSPVVVIVAAILLAIYGSHQPRQMEYRLSDHGIEVGSQAHAYHEFRSFSVIPEGAFSSIVFMPLKRFALPLTLYYDPKDEDRIVDLLANQLPLENRRPDLIDSLMRRIRF